MQVQELTEKIENGSDIMFEVMGRHFTILTWHEKGIAIDEQHPNDGNMQFFTSAGELVSGFAVDGKPLADIADQIIITDYT